MKMLDWGSVKYALMQHVNIFSNRHLAINYCQLTYMYIHDIQYFTVETISVFKAVGGGGLNEIRTVLILVYFQIIL